MDNHYVTLFEYLTESKVNISNNIDMEKKTEELFNDTLEIISSGKKSHNLEELKDLSFYFGRLITKFNIRDDLNTQKVYYLGMWKALYELYNRVENKEVEKSSLYADLASYKYLSYFIKELYNRNTLSHTELTNILGIKKNTLSNFLRRVEKLNCYVAKKIGKSKYYFLTSKGLKYFSYLREKEVSENFIDNYQNFVINLLKILRKELRKSNPSIERIRALLLQDNDCYSDYLYSKGIQREVRLILKEQEPNINDSINIYRFINYSQEPRIINKVNELDEIEKGNLGELIKISQKSYQGTFSNLLFVND